MYIMPGDCSFVQCQWLMHDELGLSLHIYIYIYIYIYICSSICVQEYLLLYMHICRPYMHILGLEYIYIDHIYIFSRFICLFSCLVDDEYMQIGATKCKYMLYCTSMPPPIRRVTLESVQQN